MQRIAFPALFTTLLALTPAFADPLDLGSAAPAPSQLGTVFAAAPAPTRYAAAQTNYGGGFLEMLFRGPGQEQPRASQPEASPQPAPVSHHSPFADPEADGYANPGVTRPARATIDPRFEPQEVSYSGSESPGTIIINTRERHLYLVQANGRAMRYGIGVGRPGFSWSGRHSITAMREWPDWRPPAEMLRRQPHLPRYMPGGPDNPLGARAMYLGSTLYRIHGSNEPHTIGQAVSSGCIRMRNEDVIDLYRRVHVGTRVVVM